MIYVWMVHFCLLSFFSSLVSMDGSVRYPGVPLELTESLLAGQQRTPDSSPVKVSSQKVFLQAGPREKKAYRSTHNVKHRLPIHSKKASPVKSDSEKRSMNGVVSKDKESLFSIFTGLFDVEDMSEIRAAAFFDEKKRHEEELREIGFYHQKMNRLEIVKKEELSDK